MVAQLGSCGTGSECMQACQHTSVDKFLASQPYLGMPRLPVFASLGCLCLQTLTAALTPASSPTSPLTHTSHLHLPNFIASGTLRGPLHTPPRSSCLHHLTPHTPAVPLPTLLASVTLTGLGPLARHAAKRASALSAARWMGVSLSPTLTSAQVLLYCVQSKEAVQDLERARFHGAWV